jgi:16S rRNA C967 or C1407 C5-methylase (RsmB/RsmF family)
MNKSARAREKTRLKELGKESLGLFDYVLVDAECSTDGAIR